MANNLVSPGVQVDLFDDSSYAPNGIGTVPFIVIATSQDKTNASGTIATGTTIANAGKIFTATSQRELNNLFGTPYFPTDSSGNRIHGSELAEYGLYAAHSVLDIISKAYIVRADVDLNQLTAAVDRPKTKATGGTLWLNSSIANWGVFEWNDTTQTFVRKTPAFLFNNTYVNISTSFPLASYGNVGDYAIVGVNSNNPLFTKNYLGNWVLVGSNTWSQTCAPVFKSPNTGVTFTAGDTFIINGVTVTISSDPTMLTDSALVDNINALSIAGITAGMINGHFALFVSPSARSGGPSASVDGKIIIQNDSGSVITRLGIPLDNLSAAFTSLGPTTAFSRHSNVPAWKTIQSNPRPTGSVWIKTTNFNYGANITVYRRNSVTNTWDLAPNLLYSNAADAIYGLDPTNGGLGIAKGTLFTKYNSEENGTVQYKTFVRSSTGPAVITGSTSNPALTSGSSFTIRATQVGSNNLTALNTITITTGNTVSDVAAKISQANISQTIAGSTKALVTASISATGNLVLTHPFGGSIYLADVAGSPLSELGITTDLANVYQNTNQTGSEIVGGNWSIPNNPTIVAQPAEPTAVPDDGRLWFFNSHDVDIMINVNNQWKGYRNVLQDYRGYDLTQVDPNGPILAVVKPTANSMGEALVYGDLWINTSAMDKYPLISRWESVNGVDQWVVINNTDYTTTNGIIFADTRWDTDGTKDVFTDDIVPINSMLLSDYVDLDAPDPDLYADGCLLFNTRRSGNNVKKYVKTYFTVDKYPLLSLPAISSTWQSYSGKNWNNVPFFGRQAQRNVIVSAMEEAVDNNTELREEGKAFNLLCSPGYVELLQNLVVLNEDRKETGFIIGEVPMGLSTDSTTIENYLINPDNIAVSGEAALNNNNRSTAIFYPGAALVDPVEGVGSICVPTSALMLRTFIRNDQIGELWFAPAGNTRGVLDNARNVGYLDRSSASAAFVPTGVPQGLRDLLYQNQVNPITFFPGVGRINYGNHTRQADATALDRINVSRLVSYIRANIEILVRPLVFEPNDKITRDKAKALIEKLLNDIHTRRGLNDYIVVCDRSNNTNAQIDRNELHVDVAIEPIKAVEFIYIPIRLKSTGQINSGNISPSTPLA